MSAEGLSDLIARVESATAEPSSYDRFGYDALVLLLGRDEAHTWLYAAWRGDPSISLDSALALVERVRPDLDPIISRFHGQGWGARLDSQDYGRLTAGEHFYSPTPALALILALLRALEAAPQTEEGGSSSAAEHLSPSATRPEPQSPAGEEG